MSESKCSVEGCSGPDRMATKSLCTMHYARKRRTGSVGPPGALYNPDKGCSVDGCDGDHVAKGWCGTHYTRWRVTGDPLTDRPPGVNISRRKPRPPDTWRTVHIHLQRVRGKARRQLCKYCGEQAADWCYDGTDPDVRYTEGTQMPFSLHLEHYIPLCRTCHKRLDNLNRSRDHISETAILRNQQKMIETLLARIETLETIMESQAAS